MRYGVNELRKSFLDFFEEKEHLALPSFSLIPHNDKSLLLINAGMAPLKPYFTGQEEPPKKRVATCQKCIRTGDIDNVGKTARHLTFFEMLGNFSFGDYFKKESLQWSWEYLTEVLGLSPERLYPSIYGEDEEAFAIWRDVIGVPAEKIKRFYRDPKTGECDNFWEHGAGPCGPCSEIYYDRGEKYGCGKSTCGVGCDCDRFMEVWNNVFTQFEGDGHGNYEELENKNIDTGMGLERLAVVMQEVDSVYDIDTMRAIRDEVCSLSHKTYGKEVSDDISIRLITDHIRSATFMVCDGVLPSNEGRGYVLRRLIRRAARHGRMLGIENNFLDRLSEVVIRESHDGYPELMEKRNFIHKVLSEEEEKFNKTIDQGLEILADLEEGLRTSGQKKLSGEDAFRLYDTYGFPLDLTMEILSEKGFGVDEEGFAVCMEKQRDTARMARKTTNYMGADATIFEELEADITTEFTGYDHLQQEAKVLVLTKIEDDGTERFVGELKKGDKGTILTDVTPFYATKGGQQADHGLIEAKDGVFQVEDTVTLVGERNGHIGTVTDGVIRTKDAVKLSVDEARRFATAKNHSATHLLHKALKIVLGDHVNQAGSDVNRDRLRFDFTHFSAMSQEELKRVEEIVNEQIRLALPVITHVMNLEEAKKSGAEAHFDEKYGANVRVVTMGDFSSELCGGTHVSNTGDITAFKILSENGVASGVRRIEALTSNEVFRYFENVEKLLEEAAQTAKSTPSELCNRIRQMNEELRRLSAENASLKSAKAKDALGDVSDQVQDIGGVSLVATRVEQVDMNDLRELGDQIKDKLGEGVVVLASEKDGKVSLVAMATPAAIAKGAHAGNLIKSIAGLVGGGGGGRDNMAQAGGKNPDGMDAALTAAVETLKSQIQ